MHLRLCSPDASRLSCGSRQCTSPPLQLVACESPVGRLGLTTCYDVRFPEMYQALRFNKGAQVGGQWVLVGAQHGLLSMT
jgi:predicted amidohydrolase